ncbi:chemotaxis protein CheX [Sulfurimonas paralvinellae]|uniref:Chemotaxis protein CheX n=1 Tax=Sulfurimonas paralvinellae TaxID=317658 RepID=A0A7M1BAA1_9BACT|nr:chemotaxis protein CheX [Sulfurimonas paralvinellae]QOP45758.1 chemotaxis protein CheX [Sulfurimonas paralvinellae]
MLDTIKQAAENFCIHQIREPHLLEDGSTQKRTLIAYIDIDTQDNKKHRVYIASDKEFMQRVSKLFLEEDESDEDTLKDMTLETANLIIGSAKVIAEETNDNPYTISTPKFEKIGAFDFDVDESKTIKVDNDELTIAIKEIDA